MSDLLTSVIPLALGAAVSPTVLAANVIILGGRRSITRGLVFTGFPWIASGYAHAVGPLAAWAPWR